ncbi:MAG: pectinesterase family protein, partial [Paludibacter sp.]
MQKSHLFAILLFTGSVVSAQNPTFTLFPENKATQVNPDTHIELTFDETPTLGNTGKISVYDVSTNKLVDMLDLSIPAGPTQSVNHGAATPSYTKTP